MRRVKSISSWLVALAVLILTYGLVSCTSFFKNESSQGAYPIMQGVTGPTWTRLNLLREKGEDLSVRFFDTQGQEVPVSSIQRSSHEFAASRYVVDEFQLTQLPSLSTGYVMRVEKDGILRDERRFKLRPSASNLSFAVVSCSDDAFKFEQAYMWKSLVSQKPDLILTIGDNAYADREEEKPERLSSPKTLWKRYANTRRRLEIFRIPDLIPIVAVWDDHDYGMNNGDRRYPHREESLQIFRSFFPQGQGIEAYRLGPGAASRFIVGEQQFLFLDNRSFRSPNQTSPACLEKKSSKLCQSALEDLGGDVMKNVEPETHFGKKQTQWALEQIKSAGSDVTWMISGDQWFGGYSPFESFQGNHPRDFKKFMSKIRDLSSTRVAFLSGDRHSSEISRIPRAHLGYESFEVVSSPIHARVYPSNWGEFPNPDQLASIAQAFNYTIVRSDLQAHQWKLHIQNFHWDAHEKRVEPSYDLETLIDRPIAE